MHTTCVNSKDNAKSNDSDHIFVIRENTRLKHRCPLMRKVKKLLHVKNLYMFNSKGDNLKEKYFQISFARIICIDLSQCKRFIVA